MAQRLVLQALLEATLGSNEVHYQPPANVDMDYPAIRYELEDVNTAHADGFPYRLKDQYLVTVITRDPDEMDGIRKKIEKLPSSRFNRRYVAENLNHTVYTLFF